MRIILNQIAFLCILRPVFLQRNADAPLIANKLLDRKSVV